MDIKIPEALKCYGPLSLRLTIGPMFIAHGAQKLFGWFGGHGLMATGEGFAQMGFTPGVFWAGVVGSSEFFGGLCVLLGFLTRWVTLPLIATMLVAIFKVHWSKGFFAPGGFEYPFVILGGLISLLIRGAGKPSLDARLCPSGSCASKK